MLVDTKGPRDALRHMLYRKLDAECDRQTTVVGRLLTTLGDDRRGVAKLFLVQRLDVGSTSKTAYLNIRQTNFFTVTAPPLGNSCLH